jgi:iron(III) transport system permease protein
LLLGFFVPAYVLARLAFGHGGFRVGEWFIASAGNSLMLSAAAAVIAVTVAVFLVYGNRLSGDAVVNAATRFASLGYAVPGAVLAIGVLVPFAALDNAIDAFLMDKLGISSGLILSGTVFALIFGYVVRFLALAVGTVDASLGRISPNVDGAARTLGHGVGATLAKVHLPLMRGSLLTAAILVFVDGMKELPMTVVMRPFNFETLATQVHQFASAEQFADAAPAALAIVATGVLPVIAMSLAIAASRPGARYLRRTPSER